MPPHDVALRSSEPTNRLPPFPKDLEYALNYVRPVWTTQIHTGEEGRLGEKRCRTIEETRDLVRKLDAKAKRYQEKVGAAVAGKLRHCSDRTIPTVDPVSAKDSCGGGFNSCDRDG